MSKIAELLGLKAKIEELENEIKNETISFTKAELVEYTKMIGNAAAEGFKHELKQKENFDFDSAVYTKRGDDGIKLIVSRTKVLDEVVKSVDWNLDEDNVNETVEGALKLMNK